MSDLLNAVILCVREIQFQNSKTALWLVHLPNCCPCHPAIQGIPICILLPIPGNLTPLDGVFRTDLPASCPLNFYGVSLHQPFFHHVRLTHNHLLSIPVYASGDCPDNGKMGKLAAFSPCRACPAHPISPVPPNFLQILEKFDILRKIQKTGQRAMSKASNNH